MTNVTVKSDLTPSQQIAADGNSITFVNDSLGRKIGLRKVKMSIRRRVIKTISGNSAEKERYLGLCMLAASVDSIDDEKVSLPTSEIQFDALIDRLDDEGFEAVASVLVNDAQDQAKTAGE